jgi:hypothetical protein
MTLQHIAIAYGSYSALSARVMVDFNKSFRKEIRSAQRTGRSVMALLALMWVVGCLPEFPT